MSEEAETPPLQALIPKNLDDIIRANRDQFRLAFATDEEMQLLERGISVDQPARHAIKGWNILMMHAMTGGKAQSVAKLLGTVEGSGQCWITSTVKAIDREMGLVQTENSFYRIVGPRSFEPSAPLLLHVCVFLNERGAGPFLGIPAFFY